MYGLSTCKNLKNLHNVFNKFLLIIHCPRDFSEQRTYFVNIDPHNIKKDVLYYNFTREAIHK